MYTRAELQAQAAQDGDWPQDDVDFLNSTMTDAYIQAHPPEAGDSKRGYVNKAKMADKAMNDLPPGVGNQTN